MKTNEILVKKYANRRLYDTSKSIYVTLEDLREYVIAHKDIKVVDVQTNEDITNVILLQIILEQENKGINLVPKESLAYIIRLHKSETSKIFGDYLNYSITQFENHYKEVDGLLDKLNPFYSFIKNFTNNK